MEQETINPGLLFYKEYFFDDLFTSQNTITGKIEDSIKNQIEKNNQKLLKFCFHKEYVDEFLNIGKHNFELTTTYPGLLCGSGYMHNINVENAFKIGFFFDYTTGLPTIPGSTVKGLLRSVFPGKKNKSDTQLYRQEKAEYIKEKLENLEIKLSETDLQLIDKIYNIELEIFEGSYKIQNEIKTKNIYNRDIFFDAFISKTNNHNNLIFGNDAICPHRDNPLKNPKPLNFLKILPEVTFKFQFKLDDSEILPQLTSEKKLKLFEDILLDLGIGAKTNVGYGQFKQKPQMKKFKEDQFVKGIVKKIDNNRVSFLIEGTDEIKSLQVEQRKLKNYSINKEFNLRVKRINEDGSIKSISLK